MISTGVCAVAATAWLSGICATIVLAILSARGNAFGSASLVTMIRCFARYTYHCLYGEWPDSSKNPTAATANRSKTCRRMRFVRLKLRRPEERRHVSLPPGVRKGLLENIDVQEIRNDEIGDVNQVADMQVASHAAQEVGLRARQLHLRRRSGPRQKIYHLERRIARGQRGVFRLVGQRSEEAIEIFLGGDYFPFRFDRNTRRCDKPFRFKLLQHTTLTLKARPCDERGLTLLNFDFYRHDGVHLHCRAGDFTIRLRKMRITH